MTKPKLKRCAGCRDQLPPTSEYFHVDSRSGQGLRARCKKCTAVQKSTATARRKADSAVWDESAQQFTSHQFVKQTAKPRRVPVRLSDIYNCDRAARSRFDWLLLRLVDAGLTGTSWCESNGMLDVRLTAARKEFLPILSAELAEAVTPFGYKLYGSEIADGELLIRLKDCQQGAAQ